MAGGTEQRQPRSAPLPARVVAMVRRLPPPGAPVVRGSTPVVAFGDPTRAEVATLGINPSHVEFAEGGELLPGDQRRLATLNSVGADRLDRLTDQQVAEVVGDCAGYFQRRPYGKWFNPLDQVLRDGLGASYYDGTACHLDLVQWATDPIWSDIDKSVRQLLLDDGVPHLRTQLAQDHIRLVVMNGRQVVTQVKAAGLAALYEVGVISLGTGTYRTYVGEGSGVRWVGWSANLQGGFGISTGDRQQLAARLADLCAPPAQADVAQRGTGGYLPYGARVDGKRELVALLDSWLHDSGAATIGDVGSFGGRAWLSVAVSGHEIVLNADTKRAAVEAFVHRARLDPERPWRAVANRRGRINKVLPDPHGEPLPGWYAYLAHPLSAEETI